MNQTVKQLLTKRKLSGKDIGRLFIANLIDIYNGDPLPNDKILELAQSVQTDKDNIDYALYRKVYFALDAARDLAAEKLKQAHIACTGLRLFSDIMNYATNVFSDDELGPYQLGKMDKKIRADMADLWLRLRSSVQAYLATKGAFQAAGEWLKIPGLENLLPGDSKLRQEVKTLSECCLQSREYFISLPDHAFVEMEEIFMPIDYDSMEIGEKDIAKAKKLFRLATFELDIENAIALLNPYSEADDE